MANIQQWLSVQIDDVVRGQFSAFSEGQHRRFSGFINILFSCAHDVNLLIDIWSASVEVETMTMSSA